MSRFRLFWLRVMQGRNGTDALNRVLFLACLVTAVLSLLLPGIGKFIFYYLSFFLLVWCLYRTLSRQVAARQRENAAWLRLRRRAVVWGRLQKRKWADRKTHVFRRCPHCRATVRLPKKPGRHTVTCPKCRQDFEVKI